jgi:hypothetical protein
MLYDELIKQLPMEMGELLEEAKVEFRRWHFEQTWKYKNALNATYQNIRQLEGKYKEEKDTKEVVNDKATTKEVKQVSLLEEDEDETTPIRKLIRKHEVVDLTSIGKAKEQ